MSRRPAAELELARERLSGILARARKLDVSTDRVLDSRPAKRLIARTSGLLGGRCAVGLGLLCLVVAALCVYARWPTLQDTDTVRTVLRRTCGSGDIADSVAAALLRSSSSTAQDDSC
ncbi:uncharacterized protein LOC131666822 [Phymastichus coffea]|uniref:uncharacterized protein LOC131666822 n=1 Tax=Phymastichus coffea TaxID=108790 RepID=UPI00273BE211|nr:uncharacterized protein LOC131666822 [Phymastichus coffea]